MDEPTRLEYSAPALLRRQWSEVLASRVVRLRGQHLMKRGGEHNKTPGSRGFT